MDWGCRIGCWHLQVVDLLDGLVVALCSKDVLVVVLYSEDDLVVDLCFLVVVLYNQGGLVVGLYNLDALEVDLFLVVVLLVLLDLLVFVPNFEPSYSMPLL